MSIGAAGRSGMAGALPRGMWTLPNGPRGPWSQRAAALSVMALGLLLYTCAAHDDAYITYGAADALARHGALVNFNGDRVEQSSSLAQVVGVAALARLGGLPVPVVGFWLTVLLGAVAVRAGGALAERLCPGAGARGAWLLATTAGLAYATVGGLETTAVAALLPLSAMSVADYVALGGARRLAGLGAALVVWLTLRPESPLVLLCTLLVPAAFALRARLRGAPPASAATRRRAAVVVALSIGLTIALALFRQASFGAILPNPVYAKVGGVSVAALQAGLTYLFESVTALDRWPLALGLVGAVFTLWMPGGAPSLVLSLTLGQVGAYLGFIVLTGGDWMTGGRFLVFMLPSTVALAVHALDRLAAPVGRRVLTGLLLAANLFTAVALARGASIGRPLWTLGGLAAAAAKPAAGLDLHWHELAGKAHLRDAPVASALNRIIERLRTVEPTRRLVLMSHQAGFVPYQAFARFGPQALRFLDAQSLTTRDFTACLPAAELRPAPTGARLDFGAYFARAARLEADCGIPRPDIVFGLARGDLAAAFERHGYTPVYRQSGVIPTGAPGDFFYNTLRSDYVIAVRKPLAEAAGLTLRRWKWQIP
jgi:hypothetical protein